MPTGLFSHEPFILRRIGDISGNERDAIMADLRDLMLKYEIRPGTLRRLAEIAVKEMRG